jgi:hypothetical protein
MRLISGIVVLVATLLLCWAFNSNLGAATKDALTAKLREIKVLKWNIEVVGAFLEAALEAALSRRRGQSHVAASGRHKPVAAIDESRSDRIANRHSAWALERTVGSL